MRRYLVPLILLAGSALVAEDAQMQIRIDSSGAYLHVELENSLYKAVIRSHQGAACGTEHAIRDWVIKATGEDQVGSYIDACAQRGPLGSAEVVYDGPERMTLRGEYEDCPKGSGVHSATLEYSIFPHSPVIRVDYLKYPSIWTNTVDIGTPGGSRERGEYRFYGQQEYASQVRDVTGYPGSYWNIYDGGEYLHDPLDAGPLNYHGHLIMAVGNPDNSQGFGRVMPVYHRGERGGAIILKLLGQRGFETFPRVGQTYAPPFTGYLYMFTEGLDEAVLMGQRIVDGWVGDVLPTAVASAGEATRPDGFELYGNSPNPFNAQTIISYRIPQRLHVQLEILDGLGQNILDLVDQVQNAGDHRISMHARGLPSGIYLYRLRAGGIVRTGKMTLVQ
jgi:hypothetical protein